MNISTERGYDTFIADQDCLQGESGMKRIMIIEDATDRAILADMVIVNAGAPGRGTPEQIYRDNL